MKMQGWVLRWLVNAVAVLLMIFLVPETYTAEGVLDTGFSANAWGGLVGALLMGVLNAIIRPLLHLINLPFTYINAGVVTVIFNALFMYLTVSTVKGFELAGWAWSLLIVLLLSAVSLVLSMMVADDQVGFGR